MRLNKEYHKARKKLELSFEEYPKMFGFRNRMKKEAVSTFQGGFRAAAKIKRGFITGALIGSVGIMGTHLIMSNRRKK